MAEAQWKTMEKGLGWLTQLQVLSGRRCHDEKSFSDPNFAGEVSKYRFLNYDSLNLTMKTLLEIVEECDK